jgi:hypothetical protein
VDESSRPRALPGAGVVRVWSCPLAYRSDILPTLSPMIFERRIYSLAPPLPHECPTQPRFRPRTRSARHNSYRIPRVIGSVITDLVVTISASIVALVAAVGIIVVGARAKRDSVTVGVSGGYGPTSVNTGSGTVVGEVVDGDKFVVGGDAVGRDKITVNIGPNSPATSLTALPVPRDGRVIASRSTVRWTTLAATVGLVADVVSLSGLFSADADARWIIASGMAGLVCLALLAFRINLLNRSVVPRRLPRTENRTRSFYQLTDDGLMRVDLAIECPACEQGNLAPATLAIGKVVTGTRLGHPSKLDDGTVVPPREEEVKDDRLVCPKFPEDHNWRLGEPR